MNKRVQKMRKISVVRGNLN